MIWLERCGSTNTELLARDLPHGSGLATHEQTAGRGRLGRVWEGRRGNLHLSVVFRRTVPNEQLPLITLGAGVVLAETVGFALKWPNDLVDEQGHKLAGILAEAEWSGGALQQVVVGIGVNVAHAPFPRSACIGARPLEPLAESLRRGIANLDLGTVRQRWLAHNQTLGREVVVGDVQGRAVDLADNGALIIRHLGGLQTVITGDLLFGRC